MYVRHEAKDHNAWVDQKKNWKKGAKFNQPTPSDSTSLVTEHKLGLSTDLKAAMVANFQCTQEEIAKLWLDVIQNNDLNQRVGVI